MVARTNGETPKIRYSVTIVYSVNPITKFIRCLLLLSTVLYEKQIWNLRNSKEHWTPSKCGYGGKNQLGTEDV